MSATEEKISVALVQQAIWDMPMASMPLAAGYLKAAAQADDRITERMNIRIRNYRGGAKLATMATELFEEQVPDILAFSVLGWNARTFGALAETFKQINPRGWVVFGGTHVTDQAERVFRMYPHVDVVVNGEGELVFRELLNAYLDGPTRERLFEVEGISFRGPLGEPITTPRPERIADLDTIPSPILTGAIDLTGESGEFGYDVALMETNRGCPYKCAFCYWGGAIGQKVRAFSRERLREEMEVLARLKVNTVALCDANFGLLRADEEFVDDLLRIRERYGYPRALETSWAKNKSKVFYSIVQKMKDAGLRSSFTLALQTLDSETLSTMNRRNMKMNEWEDLVAWLTEQGLDCYAELIWGAPGETVESFIDGYDRLSHYVSRIAVYPILLLPNTEYTEKKQEYGMISVRGEHDDFEYVLAHDTMSFEDNRRMQRFLFWSRLLSDAAVFRHSWAALRELGGIPQSQVLLDMDEWVRTVDDAAAAPLRDAVAIGTDAPGTAVAYIFGDPDAKALLERWWRESIRPRLPEDVRPVLDEVFRYDLITLPAHREPATGRPAADLTPVRLGDEDYYLRSGVELQYDVPAITAALTARREPDLSPHPAKIDLYYRPGVETWTNSTNSEEIIYFLGMTRDEALASRPPAVDPAAALLVDKGGCS